MKKLLTIATLLVVFMGILSVNVNAATKKSTKNKSSNTTTTTSTKKEESSADTVDEIYEIGKKYGMTAKDKQELQNFIDRNGLTNAQVEKLLAKTKEAEKVMTAAGATDYNKLTKAQKEQLLLIDVLVSFIQAYVFTMLSTIFISLAQAEHEEHGAHGDAHSAAAHASETSK